MTWRLGHETPSDYKQSFCEIRTSNVFIYINIYMVKI